MSNDAATKYLQDELRKLEKRFQVLLVAMGIVLVVVVGYFQWIKSQTAELLQPDSLGEFMVNEVRRGLPDASESLKQAMRDQAPDVVRFVVQHVVDGVFPIIRAGVEDGMKEYSKQLTAYGADRAMEAFEEVVRTYKTELGQGTDADEDSLAMRLNDLIQVELEKKVVDESGESLQSKLDQSAVALRRINTKLQDLARQKNLTRQQELGKRLITTWWTFLERNRGDLPAGQLLMEVPLEPTKTQKAWSPKPKTVPAAP